MPFNKDSRLAKIPQNSDFHVNFTWNALSVGDYECHQELSSQISVFMDIRMTNRCETTNKGYEFAMFSGRSQSSVFYGRNTVACRRRLTKDAFYSQMGCKRAAH